MILGDSVNPIDLVVDFLLTVTVSVAERQAHEGENGVVVLIDGRANDACVGYARILTRATP